MKALLDDDEVTFIDETKNIISDYLGDEMIMDKLVFCTKNQINKNNFIHKFPVFQECLEAKMIKLANPESFGSNNKNAKFPNQVADIEIAADINNDIIVKAIQQGWKSLKKIFVKYKKLNSKLGELESRRDIQYLLVLRIIAKANLEYRFNL